ncbi:mechanosensitive ion channel family protein [Wenzhouxiangella marina]|uniref:Low conductance mechanosensitive channel YnaI n=1 Tax=Wenzhouxiangella marina TaxID=1579979 RepID=A0A0K0XVN6_9GAMM|nr:mechanosensitive ion channel family protein [Wenzhouxiangella marina]AKS41725.1 Low conductance mechanosensitive channel YnaI [Wenzhouxiangella marina]MBB6086513.1 MscS family membrane protein [Wenzhouxiangella marina]
MNDYLKQLSTMIGIPGWVLTAFLIILAALLLEMLYRIFVGHLARLAEKSAHLWDDAVVYAGRRPVSLLIWWQGLVMAARVIAPHTEAIAFSADLLNALQQLGLVVAATWFAFRLVTGFENAFVAEKRKRDQSVDITTVSVLGRIVRIAVIMTGALTILSILEIPISGFLAAGGVGGIAVGLAARDLLANFFGGFMVFMDRPFSVGDWVRSPDQNIEGTVEKIGWRMTTIRKFDKRPMYVPNATFTTITVENPSRMTHRRISEHIGIRYDDFAVVRPVVDAIREMILGHEELDTSQTTMVHFDVYNASSLDIMIYCFTKTTVWTEYHRVREDVLLKIGEIIEAHGAEIAFPTRTLKIDSAPQPTEAGS